MRKLVGSSFDGVVLQNIIISTSVSHECSNLDRIFKLDTKKDYVLATEIII